MSILLMTVLTSCNSHKSSTAASDTTQVLTRVLTNKKFLSDFPKAIDTLYLVKSKYYNPSWPNKIGKLHIMHIADNEEARTPHKSWNKLHHPKWKCMITKFSISGDSAKVRLLNFSIVTDYYYVLTKKGDSWEVASLGRLIK